MESEFRDDIVTNVLRAVVALLGLCAGAVFLIDFRRIPSRLYNKTISFWAGAPGVRIDYSRVIPFWLYRYAQAIGYIGAAVIASTLLVKSM